MKDYNQKELWEIMKKGENAKDYKEKLFFNTEEQDIEKLKEQIKNYVIVREWKEADIIYQIETRYKNNEMREQLIKIIKGKEERKYSMYFKNI